MGVFISTLARAQERQGEIVLVNPAHKVKAIFEMFGLMDAFKIVPDMNAALAAF
jgi:anti-anti-sigma factor